MKNKKPKTIEDLFKNGFVVTNIVQPYTYEAKKEFIKQIKQLIADEVIDLVTEFELDRYESNGKMFYAVSDVVSMARKRSKEQRKKLESL